MSLSETPTYKAWERMIGRCRNSNNPYYGGRGISYSIEWRNFSCFLADMGEKPAGAHLDRIDNDGDYCKGNCRWTTHKENMRNCRQTRLTVEKVKLINGLLRSVKRGTPLQPAYRLIAVLFKVKPTTIRDINEGNTWKDVP